MLLAEIANGLIRMTGVEVRKLMRAHRVTIREVARRMNVPQRVIRAARRDGLKGFGVFDTEQAITGEFSARRSAQLKQIRAIEESRLMTDAR